MEEVKRMVNEVLARYGQEREALVEVLRELNDKAGHLNREILAEVADRLDLPESEVFGVASFYSMLNVEQLGEHVVKLCEDAPCHVAGGRKVWEALEHELGIEFGQTTPDGQWSLLPTSCIGLCAVGPVMLVDGDVYGNLTPEKIPVILSRYREAPVPAEEAPEPIEEPLGGEV
jgi:NADH-quinone oxidoreductase subunit E